MSSVLPGASSANTAQPGFVILLLDPSPYRVLRCNARSDNLFVYPAIGNKNSSSFAPEYTIWSPPKPSVTLATNTDPMEFDVPMSPSPVTPPTLADIADSFTLTSTVPNQSVAFFTVSAAGIAFAAQLKYVYELEALSGRLWRWKKNVWSAWKFNFKSIAKSWHRHNKNWKPRRKAKHFGP